MQLFKPKGAVLIALLFATTASAEENVNAFATLDQNDPAQMSFALEFASGMLDAQPTGQFEILAGGEGISMLLADKSPVLEKIKSLGEKYPKLTFQACTQTTGKMRKVLGPASVKLVPRATEVDCDARYNELVTKGWARVDLSAVQE